MSNAVKLDVGGTVFKTSLETIKWYPDSKLAKMSNNNSKGQSLFLDLDPDYFRVVLNWLR